MNAQALYDLSPLARMMAVGLVLALGPMAWVWLKSRKGSGPPALHALTLVTLFLTFDLVLFGAFTRLSDSGLGCPDWPGCYGNASPLGARAEIAAAQSALPTGPVTHGKAWIEMIHRYLATGVGVLILVMAVASWVQHFKNRAAGLRLTPPVSPWLATATLVWVCVQGAFGALTVTMKLFPAIVTLHLMGGLVLLALLTVQVVRQKQFQTGSAPVRVSPGVRGLMWVTFAILVVQIALGGWVSTNYAVLACNEFPRCQNSWWPHMDFEQGFQIWRKLGMTSSGENIGFAALTAIHYVHRMMAVGVLLAAGALAWALNGSRGGADDSARTSFSGSGNSHLTGSTSLRAQSRWIAGLIGLQLATGLSNVVFDWPLLAALLHTGGAGALVIVMTWTVCASRSQGAIQSTTHSATSPSRTQTSSASDPGRVRLAHQDAVALTGKVSMHTRSMNAPEFNR
jgi:heme a synthase